MFFRTLSLKDNLLKGSFILFVGSMVANTCNYFFQFFMSRYLSVADFGAMNSLFSLMIITSVPAISILLISTKYVSNFKAHKELKKIRFFRKKIFKRLISYETAILVLMLLVSPWVSSFLKIRSYVPVMILFLILYFSFLVPLNLGILQGLQRFLPLGICGSLGGFLRLIFGILLVLLGFRLNGAMMALFLSSFALFILPFYYLKDLPKSDSHLDDLGIGFRKILSYSLPVVLSSFGIMALANMDMILVKHYFSAEQAGIYASVAVLGRSIFYFPGIIVMAMFPIVSESFALKKNPFLQLKKAIGITLLMAGFGLIVMLAVPNLMLSFLFGKTYSQGASLLRIFSLAMFFMSLINILANFLLAIERKWFIFSLLTGCVVEILLISFFHKSLITILIILTGLTFLICSSLIFQTLRLNFNKSLVRPTGISDFAKIKSPSV